MRYRLLIVASLLSLCIVLILVGILLSVRARSDIRLVAQCGEGSATMGGALDTLALSSNGNSVASITRAGDLFLWNIKRPKDKPLSLAGGRPFKCLRFLNVGETLVSGDVD